MTAAAVLQALQPNYALAAQVAPDDPEIVTERVRYPSPEGNGEVEALLVRPAGVEGPLPAVLVVHENRGLNPYIEDVARRLGKAGYLALGARRADHARRLSRRRREGPRAAGDDRSGAS